GRRAGLSRPSAACARGGAYAGARRAMGVDRRHVLRFLSPNCRHHVICGSYKRRFCVPTDRSGMSEFDEVPRPSTAPTPRAAAVLPRRSLLRGGLAALLPASGLLTACGGGSDDEAPVQPPVGQGSRFALAVLPD